MNRLLVLVASIGLAVIAVSSACIARPVALDTMVPGTPTLASDEEALSEGWSAAIAPSHMVGGSLLSA